MHFHGMHALSESFPRLAYHAPLPHLRPRNQNRSVPSFGAWSVMNICTKLAAWSHDIHQGSVSLPEYVMHSWSSYCTGFESCRFHKKLWLSPRVWVNSRWKYQCWLERFSKCFSFYQILLQSKNSMFPFWPWTRDQRARWRENQGCLLKPDKRTSKIQCSQFGLPKPQISLAHLNNWNSCEVLSQPFVGKTRVVCWMLHKRSHAETCGGLWLLLRDFISMFKEMTSGSFSSKKSLGPIAGHPLQTPSIIAIISWHRTLVKNSAFDPTRRLSQQLCKLPLTLTLTWKKSRGPSPQQPMRANWPKTKMDPLPNNQCWQIDQQQKWSMGFCWNSVASSISRCAILVLNIFSKLMSEVWHLVPSFPPSQLPATARK